MTLEEIRRLNLQDIGTWPGPAKLGALILLFAILVALGWYLGWSEQQNELDRKASEEQSLRQQYATKKAQAINLDLHQQQLAKVDAQFGALLRQLPGRSEIESLLDDINQAGAGRGLQFELFKPGAERIQEFYAELPIDIRVTGNYHDIAAFASDVAQLSRIVTLGELAITNREKEGVLAMEAVARTYRYLDESELAAQRKAKEAQKAPKK
jgi:type IV pilus assembly protein PilO